MLSSYLDHAYNIKEMNKSRTVTRNVDTSINNETILNFKYTT